jgi:hypothetical protein
MQRVHESPEGGLHWQLGDFENARQDRVASDEAQLVQPMTSLACSAAPSLRNGAAQPALDKTEISITVLGPNVQHLGTPRMPEIW